MVQPNSSKGKPGKPYPEFPLTSYSNGQWIRKIRGKIHCFGKWDDPQAALEKHNKEYPYLKAGVPVPGKFEGTTVKGMIDAFMNHQEAQEQAGQITARWLKDLHGVCRVIVAHIDKSRPVESLGPSDFVKLRLGIVSKHSPAIARNLISRIRSVFKYALDTRMISRDVDYGVSFKPPAKAQIRRHRATKPKMLWKPEDFRKLLASATPVRKAMLLLSLNCGFNGADLANVPIWAFDLRSGWLDYPRAKTGVERRVKLWPETCQAVTEYLAERPEPQSQENADLVFVTRWGQPWTTSGIGHELVKLQKIAGVTSGTLLWGRKTLQTIGEQTGDIIAVRAVMGHIDDSMSAEYRQEINDQRIEKVTDLVWHWLFDGSIDQAEQSIDETPIVGETNRLPDELTAERERNRERQIERLEAIESWAISHCDIFQELRLLHSKLLVRFKQLKSIPPEATWDETPEKLYQQLIRRAMKGEEQFDQLDILPEDFDILRAVYRPDRERSSEVIVDRLSYASIPEAIKEAMELILGINKDFDFRYQWLKKSKPETANILVYEPLFYHFFGRDNHGPIPVPDPKKAPDFLWLEAEEFRIDPRISRQGIQTELGTATTLVEGVGPLWEVASAQEWSKRLEVTERQIRRWSEADKEFIRRLDSNQYAIDTNHPTIVEKLNAVSTIRDKRTFLSN